MRAIGCGHFNSTILPLPGRSPFLLRTDHGSLMWLQNFWEPGGQLGRLQELEFAIIHRKGRKHTNADAQSRLPFSQCSRDCHDTSAHSHHIAVSSLQVPQIPGVSNVREEQLADSVMGMILREKEAGQQLMGNV